MSVPLREDALSTRRRRSLSGTFKRSRSRSRNSRKISNDWDEVSEGEFSYGETSEGADEWEEIQHEGQTKEKNDNYSTSSEKPVSRLKRTLSGKLRGSSSKINDSGPPPQDDSFHKAITPGMTSKQFMKVLRKASHIDQTDAKGQSALHVCAARGIYDGIRVLLKKGASVNLQDNHGYTPLHCAVLERKLESCNLLLRAKNIDVSISNNENSNILHYLVRVPADERTLVLYRKVLDMLIDKGVDVNQGNKHLEAPIHFACMKSNTYAVAFLLERGANCNSRTTLGETPLHYAVRTGSVKLVRLLMQNGANPAAQSYEDKVTPVDVAEQYQCSDILECLHSIIGADLFCEPNSQVQSQRSRFNENTIIKEGPLHVLGEADWENLHVVLNKQQILCTTEKSLVPVYKTRLTGAEVTFEEGSIMSDAGEQLWCFSVTELNGDTLSFATIIPEELEDWIEAIEKIIQERTSIFNVFQNLKAQSKSRRKIRSKARQIAMDNCKRGIRMTKTHTSASQFCEFLTERTEYSAAALATILRLDNGAIFKSLVKYLLHKEKYVDFMKAVLTHEIRTTVVGETLFREMSFGTRMLSAYLDLDIGREYLKSTVLGLLNDISSNEQELELNPHMTDDKQNIQANLDQIITFSQRFLDRVLSSPNQCPLEFRELMVHTRQVVDTIFPNMTHAVVGGFVFLRYICPSIIAPFKFGVSKNKDPPRREAVLVTKILQTMSNGVEFDGTKEDYMQKLNPFIKKNRLFVDIFFDTLTDPISIENQRKFTEPMKKLSNDEAVSLENEIFSKVKEYEDNMTKILGSGAGNGSPRPNSDSDTEDSSIDIDLLL